MTPGLLMLIGALVLFSGLGVVIWNFYKISKNLVSLASEPGMHLVLHIIGALLAAVGGLSLVGGFIWFLVTVAKA